MTDKNKYTHKYLTWFLVSLSFNIFLIALIIHKELPNELVEPLYSAIGAIIGVIGGIIVWLNTSYKDEKRQNDLNSKVKEIHCSIQTLKMLSPVLASKTPDIETSIETGEYLKRLGILRIGETRRHIINGLNYYDILKRCDKRFYIGAMTLETVRNNFMETMEKHRNYLEITKKDNFDFRVLSANPFDESQITSLQESGIEEHNPTSEIITALDYFEKKENSKTVSYASKYLPHTFFILTDDSLYLQPYLRNEQSTHGLTMLISNKESDSRLFEAYEKSIKKLFTEKDSIPWKILKKRN